MWQEFDQISITKKNDSYSRQSIQKFLRVSQIERLPVFLLIFADRMHAVKQVTF